MKERNNSCKLNKYTIDYYSNKWSSYDREKINKRIQNFKPYLEKVLNMIEIKEKTSILDIGTGPGTVPIALMDRLNNISNFKIYGIDPSPISISKAEKLVKNFDPHSKISFKLGRFENIPFPNNFFDSWQSHF